jgi:hypothetical protein
MPVTLVTSRLCDSSDCQAATKESFIMNARAVASGYSDSARRSAPRVCRRRVAAAYSLDPGNPGGGGKLASQCSDGIDNDGDGKIDWFGKPGGGDPGCPTPVGSRRVQRATCAPNPATAGLGHR